MEEEKVVEVVKKCAHEWDRSVYVPYCNKCGIDFLFWLKMQEPQTTEYMRLHS